MQHEHHSHAPPTAQIRVLNYLASANDLANGEQQRAQQREIDKQARLDTFRYTLRRRVSEHEAQHKAAQLQREKAIEQGIKQRIGGVRGGSQKENVPTSQAVSHSQGLYTNDSRLYVNVREAYMNQEREYTQQWARNRARAKVIQQERLLVESIQESSLEDAISAQEAEERAREEERRAQENIARMERRSAAVQAAKEAEHGRYAKALKQQFHDYLSTQNVTIPPICPCSKTPLSHNPKNCFINCVYHNKPVAYRTALTEVLSKLKIQAVVL